MPNDTPVPPSGGGANLSGQGSDKSAAPGAPPQDTPKQADEAALVRHNKELLADLHNTKEKNKRLEAEAAERALNEAKAKGEFEKLYTEVIAELDPIKQENMRYKSTVETLLKSALASLSNEQVDNFNTLFGDIADPAVKLAKLDAFKALVPSVANADAAQKGTPVSQVPNPGNATKELKAKIKEAIARGDAEELAALRNNLDAITMTLIA